MMIDELVFLIYIKLQMDSLFNRFRKYIYIMAWCCLLNGKTFATIYLLVVLKIWPLEPLPMIVLSFGILKVFVICFLVDIFFFIFSPIDNLI